MPWCDDCSKFWNRPSMGTKGECPTCGKVIAKPVRRSPWHFKVLVFGTTGYLVYRVYWFIEWLPKHV